ncbi:peptidase C14, caspase domain-containing protein [Zopfochytrium polystomum]|nr:peptidase C14, caspase domain-containing protein [Zopfochytrium polystomum]
MRRALFIGINYTGSRAALRGCHQDVKNMKAFFDRRFPYAKETLVLTDEPFQGLTYQPTRQNITNAMRWLVADARPGDHFFFHYSGHGGQLKSQTGDEDDGMDETILPLDFERAGQIRDDELFIAMCRPLPYGSFLTAIFDCCHSGTILDLPFTYQLGANGQLMQKNNFEEGGKALLQGGLKFLTGDKAGGMALAMQGIKMLGAGGGAGGGGGGGGGGPLGALGGLLGGGGGGLLGGGQQQQQQQRPQQSEGLTATGTTRNTTQATIIQWSGCMDNQTSADTQIGGMPTGAMSYAFIKALNENPNGTYLDILRRTRQLLATEYTQIPMISCGYAMNLNSPMLF